MTDLTTLADRVDGSHYWLVVNDNDLKFLNKIWRGEA